ncbi:MAG: hypothetical protein ABEH43_05535 [Flavobacteriales bacterium]
MRRKGKKDCPIVEEATKNKFMLKGKQVKKHVKGTDEGRLYTSKANLLNSKKFKHAIKEVEKISLERSDNTQNKTKEKKESS